MHAHERTHTHTHTCLNACTHAHTRTRNTHTHLPEFFNVQLVPNDNAWHLEVRILRHLISQCLQPVWEMIKGGPFGDVKHNDPSLGTTVEHGGHSAITLLAGCVPYLYRCVCGWVKQQEHILNKQYTIFRDHAHLQNKQCSFRELLNLGTAHTAGIKPYYIKHLISTPTV